MPRKKKRPLCPRCKRMTREGRLQSARATRWTERYEGKNIVKGYAKWFAVDLLCAVVELRSLGVTVTEGRENQLRATIEARAAARRREGERRAERNRTELYADSDETYAYVAGYTAGGLPFGLTWEETRERSPWEEDEGDFEPPQGGPAVYGTPRRQCTGSAQPRLRQRRAGERNQTMANEKLDLMKLHKADYAATGSPRILEVAPARYLAVSGRGAPGGVEFGARVGALYAVAFTTKMARKAEGRDYAVGKLEGLWWCDEAPGWEFAQAPRERWQWNLLIRTPDFVTGAHVAAAAKALLARGKAEPVGEVRLEMLAEGTCVQVLHVGPYSEEHETIRKMHAFAEAEGYAFHGRHHEIYLNDPGRTAPEKLRTILRHPLRPRERAWGTSMT